MKEFSRLTTGSTFILNAFALNFLHANFMNDRTSQEGSILFSACKLRQKSF